jgi:hypothetical protein
MKINVIVITNAKSSEVTKIDDNSYKIRIEAPAIDNKANKHLIDVLSEYFKVKKSSISVIKGLKSKNKIIEIDL